MDIEQIREYCLAKKETTESFPFDEHTLVFKVANKMFALLSLDSTPTSMNLKCDPDYALELRSEYEAIKVGYHMNKKHWNTLIIKEINTDLLKNLIDHSYQLVVKGLKKADKLRLETEK